MHSWIIKLALSCQMTLFIFGPFLYDLYLLRWKLLYIFGRVPLASSYTSCILFFNCNTNGGYFLWKKEEDDLQCISASNRFSIVILNTSTNIVPKPTCNSCKHNDKYFSKTKHPCKRGKKKHMLKR